jgi:hypothetical protein
MIKKERKKNHKISRKKKNDTKKQMLKNMKNKKNIIALI